MTKYLYLLLIFPFVLFGQTFKRGLILPSIDSLQYSEKYCCVLTPEEGFTVYDNPNGKVIGKIKREINKKNDQSPYSIFFISGKSKALIDSENYKEINSEVFAINYIDIVDGYVKVFDSQKSNWLKIDEINKRGFKTINWLDYLIKESNNVLGYYANNPGLRIRKEPNANSDIIGSIRGDLYEIKLTGEVSGQWCKVVVTKFKEHPCRTELDDKKNLETISEGWIKVISDEGEPNLWSYTRGC